MRRSVCQNLTGRQIPNVSCSVDGVRSGREAERVGSDLERTIFRRGAIACLAVLIPVTSAALLFDPIAHPTTTIPYPVVVLATFSCFFPGMAIWRFILRRVIVSSSDPVSITAAAGRIARSAAIPWSLWVVAIGCALGFMNRFEDPTVFPLGISVVVAAGAVVIAFIYALSDDALRPLYSQALSDDVVLDPRRSLRRRLGIYFALGNGLLLGTIGLLVELYPNIGRHMVLIACVTGAPINIWLITLASRSVTDRIENLTADVDRVRGGAYDVDIRVDDFGEVGRLQAGVREMVAGWRERERVSDLFGCQVGIDVARRAIEGGELAGAEREVSVLFVDVIGSTTLAAERSPRDVVEILNAMFDAVIETVAAAGGLVSQFQGDGALCIFGAPLEQPDHAMRAQRAAIELLRRFGDIRARYPGFDAAIGGATGTVVAGDIGNSERYQYTVIGDAVNVASRLCDEAKRRPSRVLLSESTIGTSPDGWTNCGEIELRGRPTPTAVYEPAL